MEKLIWHDYDVTPEVAHSEFTPHRTVIQKSKKLMLIGDWDKPRHVEGYLEWVTNEDGEELRYQFYTMDDEELDDVEKWAYYE